MQWLLLITIFVSLGLVIYQDFSTRLVSLWVLILFVVANLSYYFLDFGFYNLLSNLPGNFIYFGICGASIWLFRFFRNKNAAGTGLALPGAADVILALGIGITMAFDQLVFFFTASFITALLFHLLFLRRQKTVPVAAYLSITYCLHLGFSLSGLFNPIPTFIYGGY